MTAEVESAGEAVTLGTCLRPDEAALVRARAAAADRTISAEIRRALRTYLEDGDPAEPTGDGHRRKQVA
jgi:hypothetical protein